jgi:ferrous iron transport protein A
MSENNQLCLKDVKEGQKCIIIFVNGGKIATKRLADLGITIGVEVKIIANLMYGPIEIEINNSKIVLGNGLASKILVELKQ